MSKTSSKIADGSLWLVACLLPAAACPEDFFLIFFPGFFLGFENHFSLVQNGFKDCRRLTLVVACLLPAGACPEEPKLGTFSTDRGKDWGEGRVAKNAKYFMGISHIYTSRPP